jgi:hypothetical protein
MIAAAAGGGVPSTLNDDANGATEVLSLCFPDRQANRS